MRGGPSRCVRSGVAAWALVAAGCVDLPLLDPADPTIPVAGADLAVHQKVEGEATQLDFEGFVYGYIRRNGLVHVRHLDAGRVMVAGRVARRRFPRPAEPVYYYEGATDGGPSPVKIRMEGSAAVRACALEAEIPLIEPPAAFSVVPRGQDLVLPLRFAPDSLASGHRVSAELHLTSRGGPPATTVTLEHTRVESGLVVPARAIDALASGLAELSIRIVWDRTIPAHGEGPACAPTIKLQSTLEVSRLVRLE